ncbi:GDNF family receptor alpha-2-like [Acanthopagrus schlegelii]
MRVFNHSNIQKLYSLHKTLVYNSQSVYMEYTQTTDPIDSLFSGQPVPCYTGVLPSIKSTFSFTPSPTNCVKAHRVCSADPQCEALYRGLEQCAGMVAADCLQGQDALLTKHPSMSSCKCQRGFRKEEQCLRIYWTVRLLPGEEELEISPYDDTQMASRMTSLVAAASLMQLNGEDQCLKAAQDCSLYEKCGSLRSEYVLACIKRMPGTSRCDQHKCHWALQRFLERVPEEYSLGVLFCPCTNTLCGERRRKTIVPSCSYQDMEGLQPNCLHQQSFCRRDDLCRSRLADFLNNCQPSPLTSGCLKDSAGLCLRAYAGLIGCLQSHPHTISYQSDYMGHKVHMDHNEKVGSCHLIAIIRREGLIYRLHPQGTI